MLANQPSPLPAGLAQHERNDGVSLQPGSESQGCPTPLDWQQVVAAFREEREICRVQTSAGPIDAVTFGSGPPLFLLNGFLGSHELFALLAWVLRDEHSMVLLDWPTGDDRSQPISAQARLSQLALQLVEVADELGHPQWTIHATSFGCLVALQTMLDVPDRVKWASLQGAFVSQRFSLAEKALLFAAKWSKKKVKEVQLARLIQQQNNRLWFPPFDVSRWDFYAQQAGETPVRDYAKLASIAGSVDLSQRLPQIKTSLLLVSCEGDGQRSNTAQREISERLSNSRIESLDHCGAIPHITHPHRLAKLLRQFRDLGLNCPEVPRED